MTDLPKQPGLVAAGVAATTGLGRWVVTATTRALAGWTATGAAVGTAVAVALATAFAVAGASPLSVSAQVTPYAPDSVTAARYARAEAFMDRGLEDLVRGGTVRPTWLDDTRFWYRNAVSGGHEFVLVDVEAGTRERAFDHAGVAASLGALTGRGVDALALPFRSFDFVDGGAAIRVSVPGVAGSGGDSGGPGEGVVECPVQGGSCSVVDPAEVAFLDDAHLSPDGRLAAFRRDHDLWVRALATGEDRRLTHDGVEHFGYATNNAGWIKGEDPILRWSPDSKKIATFRHDARGVGDMYLVTTNVGHPELQAWRYPLPEDSVIFRIHPVILDAETGDMVRLDMAPDQHRSTVCDHVACGRGSVWTDTEWSPDARQLAFVSSSRDHKVAELRVADAGTGAVRGVLRETEDTFYESGDGAANWRVLESSGEVIWYSQKSDWGHLYMHDLATGELKHAITGGDWKVLQIRHVDEEARTIFFTAAGREPGDPYFEYLYRVNMDGSELRLLTPDSADHTVTMSPSGDYFVDSWSTPVEPPVSVVRDAAGRVVMELEEADISALEAFGWQPPIPFQVKARDGATDLHGLMWRPTDFDPSRKYPVVNYVYPGPHGQSVRTRSFSPTHRGRNHQGLAELGFVVVAVDALGTPGRSKSFQEFYYGNMGDNGIPDQIGAIRQLAERHAWIDLERVGIWGHSGGGFASADAIMRYPDFYKVAVSQAGNHDNRNYEDDWGEKWQGLLQVYPDGSTNYDNQANQLLAPNLEGKLLLAHGTLDDNVPPYNTLLVVDALIEANKDFDLIMFPNRRHGFGMEPYMVRKRWDYFVKHLMGAEPPKEYQMGR